MIFRPAVADDRTPPARAAERAHVVEAQIHRASLQRMKKRFRLVGIGRRSELRKRLLCLAQEKRHALREIRFADFFLQFPNTIPTDHRASRKTVSGIGPESP